MKFRIMMLLGLAVFAFNCGGEPKENKTEVVIEQEEQKQEDNHDHEHDGVVLNNGEKWEVVEHMMAHIQRMENDVTNFNGKTVVEYKTLSEDLIDNLNLLTSNCTMTGQAHDELHKWLLPYIDLANEFTEIETEVEAEEYFQQIQTSFVTFNQYFK